jgi:hypothetical protein
MLGARKYRWWILSTLLVLGGLLLALTGGAVHAAPPQNYQALSVIISEVAWGGTAASQADEWIELYNPGSQPINLSGWGLAAADGNPDISLEGTIGAGGFFLLERTDDSTISDITSSQIFYSPSGLSDSGEILRLYATDGSVIDTANQDGGGWPAGSAAPGYYSMERVGPVPDGPGAWASNNGIVRNGLDANGNSINGTPGQLYALWPADSNPTDTNTPTPTATVTPTQTGTATFIPTATGSPTTTGTYTATPPAPAHLVISEFRTRGPNGADDEFVELYNPTGAAVNIGAWTIKKSSSCGTSVTTLVTIPANTILLAGQHYLAASTGSSVNGADQTFAASLADDGGVVLVDVSGTGVDRAGMCTTTLYQEGTVLLPLSGNSDQSYERKPGGATSCYDTNNNAGDFALISPAHPQNSASQIVMCTGVLTSTPTSTPTSTTAISTVTPTGTSSIASPTTTATPTAPVHLVISEFRTRGPNGAGDEFVELYNPTGAAVDIGGWTIKKSSSCGSSTTNLITIPANTILLAGQHYLVTATGSSVSGADQTFAASLADDGGVALVDAYGTMVDQAGMCTTTLYQEGTIILPLSGTSDQSYERKPGGTTSCYDTNNNAGDFALISPSRPQSRASQIVMCAGVVIASPTRTPTITPTRTPTRAPTALPGIVVINEFLPHPHSDWNGDGTVNTGDEYIELMNMGTDPISLNFWKLDNGVGGHSTPYALPNMTLLPHQIVVFFHSETGISLSDGGDTVRLLKPDGRTSDIITYPVVTAADETWCRLPDGTGVWAFACSPTPGKLNIPIESVTPTPTSTPGAGGGEGNGPNCLVDPAPQPIQSAECNSPGAGMWGETGSREIWLESRWKWDVFVE